MKQSTIKLIIIIVIIIAIGIFAYIKLVPEKNNLLLKFFDSVTNTNKEQEVNDTHNGIYINKEILDRTYNITNSCHISSLDKYIIVINKDYYLYSSTCLLTYFVKQGSIEELDFSIDKDTHKYTIQYEDKKFEKDVYKKSIINTSEEDLLKKLQVIDLENLKFILTSTEVPNHFYNIYDSRIAKASARFKIDFVYKSDPMELVLKAAETTKYSKTLYNIDDLPKLYAINTDYIAIIEKQGKRNVLKIINSDKAEYGLSYNSDDNFPKLVDNSHTLTATNNTYIRYDSKNKKFDVLVSLDGKYCVEDGTDNELTFYRYEITYDYKTAYWTKMNYKEAGYAQSSCSLVKEIMGDDYGIYN